MEFIFTYELSKEDQQTFESFYNSLSVVTIEQHPSWPAVEKAAVKYCYFIARKNNAYHCTAVIIESMSGIFPIATLRFGPLFDTEENLQVSIKAIYDHYRKKNFIAYILQLAQRGSDIDSFKLRFDHELKPAYLFEQDQWSSLLIDLQKTEDELFKNLSKGHKSDIKKSAKLFMQVMEVCNEEDFESLLNIFEKMNSKRGLNIDHVGFTSLLKNTRDFFLSNNTGKILAVKDASGKVLGGMMLAFQGDTVRYFKGASDPDQRNLPVLHLAIWESIKIARSLGFHFFDLWGYNHFAKEKDQVFFINRFKKGFGGQFIYYPKKMYFVYKPMRFKIFHLLKKFRGKK